MASEYIEMATIEYDLAQFASDLRTITSETDDHAEIIGRVRPLAQKLVAHPDLKKDEYRVCDEEQGFGVHLVTEEPDHSLAAFVVSWLPGRGTPPHDHGTWAVVTGMDGQETNVFWRRDDDGSDPAYADITRLGETVAGPGECVALQPREIHSVHNKTGDITTSLHVYGKHINHTGRYQFNPETHVVEKFIVKTDN